MKKLRSPFDFFDFFRFFLVMLPVASPHQGGFKKPILVSLAPPVLEIFKFKVPFLHILCLATKCCRISIFEDIFANLVAPGSKLNGLSFKIKFIKIGPQVGPP